MRTESVRAQDCALHVEGTTRDAGLTARGEVRQGEMSLRSGSERETMRDRSAAVQARCPSVLAGRTWCVQKRCHVACNEMRLKEDEMELKSPPQPRRALAGQPRSYVKLRLV